MKASDSRYEEVQAKLTILTYLKNGGNDYSAIGVERNMMEQVDVDNAIEQIENELHILLSSNFG